MNSVFPQVTSEKSVIHERSFLSDRTGNPGKKKGENFRTDIHFPELKTGLLPELRGAEGTLPSLLDTEKYVCVWVYGCVPACLACMHVYGRCCFYAYHISLLIQVNSHVRISHRQTFKDN